MRALITTDIEGVAGIYDLMDNERNNKLLTDEVEACVKALRKNNIQDITVWDSHNQGGSICVDMLDRYNVKYFSQFRNLAPHDQQSYDFAILLGFHGMGSSGGVLANTLRDDIQAVELENGVEIGEVEILCRWFGGMGVPIILVIGDSEAVREGNFLNPNRYTCCVKGRYGAKSAENFSLLHQKIASSVDIALKADFAACLSPDDCSLTVTISESEENVAKLNPDKYIGGKALRYDSCQDLTLDLDALAQKLNDILVKRQELNIAFVKEMRKVVSSVPREAVTDPHILGLLSKGITSLGIDEQDEIRSHLSALKLQIEGKK